MAYVPTPREKAMNINAHDYGDTHSGAGRDTGDSTRGDIARPVASPDPDGGQAAARLLEMTARETDVLRSEAKSEAVAIVAGAREEADKFVQAAREEANKLVQAAREQAERLVTAARDEGAKAVNDAHAEAYRVREETVAVRKRHDEDIAHLQQVASDHRERLRSHLSNMLDQVNSTPGDVSQ
ncbi:MAG: hypothetical protein ACXVXP_09665 [Mycobacteriaceae bacterium]